MCIFSAVTPFAFSLTEPRKRNYVNPTYQCKMLQQFGGCGQVGPVMRALQWLVENVFHRALISCDVFSIVTFRYVVLHSFLILATMC